MRIKFIAVISTLVLLLSGCSNRKQNIPSTNAISSNPFEGNSEGSDVLTNPFKNSVSYKIGLKEQEVKLLDGDKLQIPLILNGDENCEKVSVKVYIDGILQEFSFENSGSYLSNNIMSVKTDDTDYQLDINAKFDEDIETHTITALSVYNPEFTPRVGVSLGNNHKAAAGAYRTLSIIGEELGYADNTVIYKAEASSPITKKQSEKYNLKGNNKTALLLLQNDDDRTYTLSERGFCALQFVAGTQAAGNEQYRVSFYKNHEIVPFNGNYFYLDISLDGGKISITDVEISDVKEGDYLYCIAVPTASYKEFAYPMKTDTVVVASAE